MSTETQADRNVAAVLDHYKKRKDSEKNPETVQVGDGATYSVGSDSYSYTVITVARNGKWLTIQADTSTCIKSDGRMGGNHEYEHTPNPTGGTMIATWRKKEECYRPKGRKTWGSSVFVGTRDRHIDPHF